MSKEIIVVVEDEVDIREVLIYNLEREGYQVFGEPDGSRGLQLIQEKKPISYSLISCFPVSMVCRSVSN